MADLVLSKWQALAGLQCRKRAYLESRRPDLAPPRPPDDRLLREVALEVAAVARGAFPGGVTAEAADVGAGLARTRTLLADPAVPAIFSALVERDGVLVRIDVLVRTGAGRFDLVEVRAGTRVRARHAADLALQLHVVEGAGVAIDRLSIWHLDREYVHPGGAYDLTRLFARVELTTEARACLAEVAALARTLAGDLAMSEPPAIAVGAHCLSPWRCSFYASCHPRVPAHPLSELRLERTALTELTARGIDDVRAVPLDFPDLTPLQRRICSAVQSGVPHRDPALRAALGALRFPVHFVDFETFSPALPRYPRTRPYEQVPYQWSDHVLAADGTVAHHEYLDEGGGDPRRAFAESLLAATAGEGSLVTYSSFEADVIAALAEELPVLAPGLHALGARIVDLLPIVRTHCYDPAFHGSFSLKTVLPALVSGLGYDDLAIRDGRAAMAAHGELADPATPASRRAELRAQLLAYCARDTEALLALYRTLWDERWS